MSDIGDNPGSAIVVRPFERRDVPAVLRFMQELADFEFYRPSFRVTEADLIEHGLGAAPRFGVFVAIDGQEIAGIAVHYTIPWTDDLRPTLVLKELFVAESARGKGIGRLLFARVREHAAAIGAPRLNWTVLPGNVSAQRFYAGFGGLRDDAWEHWTLERP